MIMNKPEQYQPNNTDERQETADAAPVSSSSDAAAPSQPEYGQISQPEYGAMSSQLPVGYDPYVYGAPEPELQPADAVRQQNTQYQTGQYPSNGPQPMPPYSANGQQNPYGANPYGPNPYDPNRYPQRGNMPYLPNLDLNDPRQNPAYGHWDAYAIMSFVFAVLMPVPVLPALVGAISMWRTKKLHMKGHGLALAAVIINVLYTLAVIWLAMHGLSVADLYNEALQNMFGGAGSGQGDESINA
ncbi:hypothetical protein [Bifidobacterium catenulatum]|uniref:hypothetical protein n=1 Tax=Bifidobacterium catenulatum TaxID=1686 RepID=UPI0012601F78|nr:hypothetical protein [Bifidobacterium catenulatum]KAB7457556.1 hypothetical protein GBA84_04065 [Bifidobacterium catenulatum]KAB7464176.1 hypothetical protein GBA80_04085 [Bifidobacterium catenulatum]